MPRARRSGAHLLFECPGCGGEMHGPLVEAQDGRGPWAWNGSLERPTLSPSVLVRWTRCDAETGLAIEEVVCHSFVRDGRIEYLGDCTHELAGRTVELPELES